MDVPAQAIKSTKTLKCEISYVDMNKTTNGVVSENLLRETKGWKGSDHWISRQVFCAH